MVTEDLFVEARFGDDAPIARLAAEVTADGSLSDRTIILSAEAAASSWVGQDARPTDPLPNHAI